MVGPGLGLGVVRLDCPTELEVIVSIDVEIAVPVEVACDTLTPTGCPGPVTMEAGILGNWSLADPDH